MEQTERDLLMNQAILQAFAFSEELLEMCSTVSACFQAGKDAQTMSLLQQLLTGLGCVSQAIQLTQPLQEARGTQIDLAAMPEPLSMLVGALENQDYTLAGDILSYEIEPVLNQWCQNLKKLTQTSPDHDFSSG